MDRESSPLKACCLAPRPAASKPEGKTSYRLKLFVASSVWLFLILGGCARRPPLTPFSAGEYAARLANDRCQRVFGQTPFNSDDYEAVLENGRWVWGGEEARPIDGYLATITFDARGAKEDVVVRRPLDGEDDDE